MAQSINVPVSVLELLAGDDNAWVRIEADKTLEILRTWTKQELADARAQIKVDQSLLGRAISRYLGRARVFHTRMPLKAMPLAQVKAVPPSKLLAAKSNGKHSQCA